MSEFYEDKKVLVTGGAGMIGRYVVEDLIGLGAKVRVADLCDKDRVHPDAEFMRVDLRDYTNCERVCSGMDYVFSLIGIKSSPLIKFMPINIDFKFFISL